ncbi:capsule synthesis protein PGA_cap [Marinobacter sp. es.048]|uniref:CapA family protein n=1 Tax=Marinobacter sp. es.048 TaxID=1761795 RepID=UPI000B58C471|nr:CapA family protein [Marinobacter sp. es.048]SNC68258.1 capsule synthesis protein PGA_cap [Marinobacter sp. es.048]
MSKLSAGRLTISAVGDISLGDHPVCAGIGMRKAFTERKEKVLSGVAHALNDSDVCIGNLETVTSDIGLNPYWLPSYEMRGSPSALKYIRAAGIDILGVANNHAMQHGREAFNDMVKQSLDAGFSVIGLDEGGRARLETIAHENGEESIVYSISTRPEEWDDNPDDVPYSLRTHTEKLVEEAKELRQQCSGFLICSMHWGLEFLDYPGPDQVELAHLLIDAGVDVILGHHPHVLQPVERYKDGLIFYSLGNFAFDLWPRATKLTTIAKVKLVKGVMPDYECVPVEIRDDFTLAIASPSAAEEIGNLLSWERYMALPDKPVDEQDYYLRYRNERKKFRYSSYQYFLKNAFRYPPWFFIQSLARTGLRRLTGT